MHLNLCDNIYILLTRVSCQFVLSKLEETPHLRLVYEVIMVVDPKCDLY